MATSREHIFIGIPCISDKLHLAVHTFLHALERVSLSDDAPWTFSWCIKTGFRPVEYARNLLVAEFLKTDATRLWFIDDDMIPNGHALQLLKQDVDIIAPSMFALKRGGEKNEPRLELCAFKYNVLGDHRFNSIVPGPGSPSLLPVDAVGTGCTIVKRRVLEDERLRLPGEYEWNGKAGNIYEETDCDRYAPAIFRTHYKPNGDILRGEDLDFSFRAKALGYGIYCMPGIQIGHCKYVNLTDAAWIAHKAALVHKEGSADGDSQNRVVDRPGEGNGRGDRGEYLEHVRRGMEQERDRQARQGLEVHADALAGIEIGGQAAGNTRLPPRPAE